MAELLQHLLNGLVLGGTYALLGIGLTLIFGLMNVVNFAHGEFYTLGAYVSFAALALAGIDFATPPQPRRAASGSRCRTPSSWAGAASRSRSRIRFRLRRSCWARSRSRPCASS